jgi:hypothetical protein
MVRLLISSRDVSSVLSSDCNCDNMVMLLSDSGVGVGDNKSISRAAIAGVMKPNHPTIC